MGMIDITEKKKTTRKATASGKISLKESTVKKIQSGDIRKGSPMQVAEVAALLAVKKTPLLIAHCHPIPIEGIDFNYEIHKTDIIVMVTVMTRARTGVEMEALIGVTTALNTIWDIVKYLEKENGQYTTTEITEIHITEKISGG